MATSEADLHPGEILAGTYEIVRKVARGGMGAVYEARHRRLAGRRVAIKLLRADTNLSQREVQRRFRREAEICSTLSHPNIIAVTDWNTTATGQPFFVMEYLDGEGLDRLMRRGKLPLPRVFKILAQVAGALQYAHERDIIHRDLKPSNIFLLSTGGTDAHVKVLDFGISKILTAGTLETTESKIIGSPRYMSPEQARGHNERLTPRSDQFGLATVAYEMLGGKAAFVGDTLSTVLFNIVYEQPQPLEDLAPDLDRRIVRVVNKAMAKDAGDRYPTVADFVRDLCAAAKAAGVADHGADSWLPESRAAGAEGRSRKYEVRRRFIAAALVALVAGAVGGWLWMRAPDLPSRNEMAGHPTDESTGQLTQRAETAPEAVVPPQPGASGGKPPAAREDAPATSEDAPGEDAPASRGDAPASREDAPASRGGAEGGSAGPGATAAAPPPDLQRRLDAAQQLLDRGEFDSAIREARRTIGKQDTAQARRIIALAYCSLGDLELAKASFRGVWRGDRASVSGQCRKLGLSL